MTDICATLGCDTFVIRPDDRYCLACQLDRGMPQPRLQSRMGRPPGARDKTPRSRQPIIPATCSQPGCSRPIETYCPLCEQFLCIIHDELGAYRGHNCLADR